MPCLLVSSLFSCLRFGLGIGEDAAHRRPFFNLPTPSMSPPFPPDAHRLLFFLLHINEPNCLSLRNLSFSPDLGPSVSASCTPPITQSSSRWWPILLSTPFHPQHITTACKYNLQSLATTTRPSAKLTAAPRPCASSRCHSRACCRSARKCPWK